MRLVFTLIINCSILIGQNPLDSYYDKAPDGKSQVRYPDGSYVEFTKANGHLHGTFYEYYDNGKLRCKAKLDQGKYIDTAFSYHKKGQIKTVDVFRHDTILYSQWDWYYDNGQISDSYRFNMHGLGIDIGKQKHGKLKNNNFLVYDIISDRRIDFKEIPGCQYTHLSFYENGSICFRKERLGDKKNGEQLRYFKNGTLKSKEHYIESKKDGQQFTYDSKGNISVVCYKNGLKVSCDRP